MAKAHTKLIVSGNKDYGVAKALAARFPSARFCSRTHGGFDFSEAGSHFEFAHQSLQYDVYVSCSSLRGFQQTLLLDSVAKLWCETRKTGHIVVLGSVLGALTNDKTDLYPIEKKALRELCRHWSLNSIGAPRDRRAEFKISYLSLGYLDTPGPVGEGKVHLGCDYVASVIDWLIQQPQHVSVSELALEPVQL